MKIFTQIKISKLLLVAAIFLFYNIFLLNAQERLSTDPLFSIVDNSEIDDSKKSTSATNGSWSADCYGSDYWVYFRWEGIVSPCPCSPAVSYIAFSYYGGSEVLRVNSPPATYLTKTYRAATIPYSTRAYTFAAPYTGKTYNIATWFDCWYGCSGTISSANQLYATAAALKVPKSVVASNKISDSRVDVTWAVGTEVPKDMHYYKVYKNGVYTGTTVQGNATLKYSDYDVEPGKYYDYTLYTIYDIGREMFSAGVNSRGYTFHLGLEASQELKTSIDLSWEFAGNIGCTGFRIERQEPSGTWIEVGGPSGGSVGFKDDSPSLLAGYLYNYRVTPLPDGTFHSYTTQGKKMADGTLNGYVTAPGGGGVDSVTIKVERLSASIPQEELNDSVYYGITAADGKYSINNIYYYEEDTFRITPSKGDHGFKPQEIITPLSIATHIINENNFTDTSSFTVRGNITINDGKCFAKDVEIWVNDIYSGVNTNSTGDFTLTVPRIDTYTFEPRLEGHSFSPDMSTFLIEDDVSDINFEDTTLFNISGHIKGSCDYYLGQADLRIFSKNQLGCLDTTITTDSLTGYYSIDLPAMEYNMEILDFTTIDEYIVTNAEVLEYFSTESVNITLNDETKDFILRRPPLLTVTGFEKIGCGDYDEIPIIHQNYEYLIQFEVNEHIGEQTCPADTGFVIIFNGLVNGPMQTDTVYLVDGVAEYLLKPGDPNIISPFTKLLEAQANVMGETDMYNQQILVTGNHPRDKTYTSVSPEIPFMILRDPPGDASYSYLEEGTTTETSLRFSSQQSGSVNAWVEAKAGVAFSAGEGVSFDFAAWGSIKGSLEVGASVSNGTEHNLSITNGQQFSTGEGPDFIGESGDLFAGAAMNIIYALTDIIEYDDETCLVNKYAKIIMAVDGFDTEFIYTESHISDVLIPQLEQIRDIYISEGSDSARLYQNQISAWQQTLNINIRQKENAAFIENRSFSAGGRVESYQEIIESSSVSYEFALYVEAGVAIEAGIEAAGSGVSGGVEAKFRAEFGDFESTTDITTTKTGYVLDDDDVGDFFSVDIFADGVYSTPVFKLVSGRSSCPWEPGTQPREGVQLITDSYLELIDDPLGQAVFRLQLGNISQSDEDRMYNLVFHQGSNPDGAELTLGGSQVQGGVLTPYYIPAGGSKEATITVKRGPFAYHYNNLEFSLLSNCEDENIADTVSLSAHFTSPCSEVELNKPFDNWVVNLQRQTLPIELTGYDISLMELIKLQYAPANSNEWVTDFTIALEDVDEEKTILDWDFAHYEDGLYDLRASVECNQGSTYSSIVSGVIDRTPPILYGLPEPADLVLDSGEFILINFDEELNCNKISAENVSITDVNSGTIFNVQVGCTGNSLMFIPELPEELNIDSDTFKIAVSGIEDLYGNSFSDTITWAFLVDSAEELMIDEEADSDGDSIANKYDNCPFSFNPNQSDFDLDGIGDKCDDDIDGDGILNKVDNCLMEPNPLQEDINEDGIGDLCQDLTSVKPVITDAGYLLYENYPNPFNDFTTIKYTVPESCRVMVKIYNATGSVIAILENKLVNPGTYELSWNSKEFSNGLYFYSLEAQSENSQSTYIKTRKMILTK